MAPEYDAAATTLKEHEIKIAKMDATAETETPKQCAPPPPPRAHPPPLRASRRARRGSCLTPAGRVCRFDVTGFPTVKVFTNGEASDYQGERTAGGSSPPRQPPTL